MGASFACVCAATGGRSRRSSAIRNDETPNFYFLHYDLATWRIKNLLLIPHFAFPPSAIIKRNPLAHRAPRRLDWLQHCAKPNPLEARIAIVTESSARARQRSARKVSARKTVVGNFRRATRLDAGCVEHRAASGIESRRRGDEAQIENRERFEPPHVVSYRRIYERRRLRLRPRVGKTSSRQPPNGATKIRQQLQWILRDTGFC